MNDVIVRVAGEKDLGSIYRMICELENERLNKNIFGEIFRENLKKDNYYLVAENEGNVVGMISLHTQRLLHHNGRVAEIQEFFVDENVRGLGIGKKLIEEIKAIAVKNSCKILEVTCNLKRIDSHRFYVNSGLAATHYKFTMKPTDK